MKSHLKSMFEKSILNDISIEKNLKIFFRKFRFLFEKYFSNLIFSMIKNKLRFFLDIYIDVKFHALSVYEVFRAIRARQTTLWSLVRCWYQKWPFFHTKCGLRTLWAPRSVDLLYNMTVTLLDPTASSGGRKSLRSSEGYFTANGRKRGEICVAARNRT